MHPKLVVETREIYAKIVEALKGRAMCRYPRTLSTNKEQDELWAQGRTKLYDANGKRLGIVTNAKGGQSYHNYGLAVDIVLLKDTNGDGKFETASWETNVDFDGDGMADWMEIVKIFKSYGWEWGGDWKFKDAPHFQKTFGYSIKQLQACKKDVSGYVII